MTPPAESSATPRSALARARVRSSLFFPRVRALAARHTLAISRTLDVVTLTFLAWLHRLFGASFLLAKIEFDEKFFLWEGWSITRRMVPYRDFQEFKPPMIMIMNALALKIFGLGEMRYRYFFHAVSLAGFLGLAAALLGRGMRRWLIIGVFPFFLALFFDHQLHDSGIDDAESTCLPFYMLGVAALLMRGRGVKIRQIAGGVLLALVPLSKEPMAFVVLATWAALLVVYRAEATEPQPVRRFVARTVGGVVGVLLVWLTYMLVTHSVRAYIEQLRETMVYVNEYAYQVGWVKRTTGLEKLDFTWTKLRENWVNGARIGIFVPLFVAAVALPGRGRRWASVAAVAAFLASLQAVSVGGGFIRHYFVQAIPGTVFLAVLGLVFLDEAVRDKPGLRTWLPVSWCAMALLSYAAYLYGENKGMAKYNEPPPPPIDMELVNYVRTHTTPQDTIWTLGDPTLYVYANRRSAVKEPDVIDELIMLQPGATDEERLAGERRELEARRPKLVVFGDDPMQGYGRKKRFLAALVMPFLNDNHYVKTTDKVYSRPD